MIERESVRTGVIDGTWVGSVFDVDDRHRVILGKEIPKAAIRSSNVEDDDEKNKTEII